MSEETEIFTISVKRKPKLSFLGRIEYYKESKVTPYIANHRNEVLILGLIIVLHMLKPPSGLVLLILGVYLLIVCTTDLPKEILPPANLEEYWDLDDEEEVMVP